MEKYKIKSATACYTGGGIYIYWGRLESGHYFRAVDDWELIFICDDDTSIENDDANYDEFYEAHTIEELRGDDFVGFWNTMLDHIISNDKSGNYCANELRTRYLKPSTPPTIDELATRISAALEAELEAVYDELRLTSGDISPLESMEWDEITAKAAYLFEKLIERNTNQDE